MLWLAAALLAVAATVVWAAHHIAGELRAAREESVQSRTIQIAEVFAPALGAAQNDPRVLLVWQPLARTLRGLMPAEFSALDRAAGSTFPFGPDLIQAAHARWTSDWLAWERTHDADYKLKASMAEEALTLSGGSPAARARLDVIEREKLELYQRRYEEYVRVSKALQALGLT
jgi:hypothetical protein